MKNILPGSFLKHAGGDFILYFDGKRWISHECVGCAIATGLIHPLRRLSTSDHPKLSRRIGYNYQIRHDFRIHNAWLDAGKPIKFQEKPQ